MEQTWELKAKIEALLVASGGAVSMAELARCLEVTGDDAQEALREFEADLLGMDRGIQLKRRPHGVRIETKPQYTDLIGRLIPERKPKPITAKALETLAIVTLKQPVATGDTDGGKHLPRWWAMNAKYKGIQPPKTIGPATARRPARDSGETVSASMMSKGESDITAAWE